MPIPASPPKMFNPCSLEDNEQIPAKIWELLRRNDQFRRSVSQLAQLDAQERAAREQTRKYHGEAWEKSCRVLERIGISNIFAARALQWLVPEPLFHCTIQNRPLATKRHPCGILPSLVIREGEGTTPNIRSKKWIWRNPQRPSTGGHPMTRGPEVFWTSSKSKWLRDKVNPIAEWKQYCWPFTVDQAWPEAPAQFRREFQFLWRSRFDCRPTNPLTGTRSDSPAPHETSFFTDWKLMDFRASGQMTRQDAYQVIRFDNFSQNYRLFAIPKTILTKASADEMGKWVASELKKGSSLYGGLLKGKLLNESEMLGTANDWTDWLVHQSGLPTKSAKTTYMYRRYRYMDSLVALIFPQFDIAKLFAPPVHRAHGKKYVRK